MPTALSTADAPWLLADCLNGFITLNTGISPTPFLHHNTQGGPSCTYAAGQAVWRNINSIPVEPNRIYTFSYRSARVNTVSDAVLSHAITTNAGGSITVLSTSNPAWGAAFQWATRQVVFRTNPGTTSVNLRINNASTVVNGNDFIMDDIVLEGREADLSITKDDGQTQYTPGGTVNYSIVVSNAGPADATGAQVSDPLPAGITTASWTCGAATGGGICGASSGTGGISTTANLPVGASVTYTLSMAVPIGFSGNLTNTATVAVPANRTDSNQANNTASDTDTQFTSPPGPGPGACNIASNGSFESPNIQTDPNGPGDNTAYTNGYAVWRTTTNPISGWQTAAGTIDILGHYNNASNGAQSIDLYGTAAATLRQTFTGLVPGQQYTFSVDYSGLSAAQSAAAIQLGNGSAVAPVTLATLRPAADGISNGGANVPTTPYYSVTWRTFRYTFVAAGTEATIQFVNTGLHSATGTGLFIDNFSFAGDAPCETDLSITKTDGAATYTPGLDTNYTIVVTNNGPGPVGAAQISDPLPAGITTASWTCGNATGGGVCAAASGTGAINTTANLPVGASVTYALSIGIPGSYSSNLVNTATVTAPTGVTEINDSNNSASDTDTMESPPTSSACSPRNVVPAMSFTLAPFPTTGTTARTGAPNGWLADNPWSTLGGDYTLTWTFSQPIPVEWLQFALVDIDTASPNGTLTISLGGGVPTSQIVKLGGDLLINSSGVVRRNSAITNDPGQSATFGFAPGGTVTWIRVTSANIFSSDHIGHRLLVRPSCLTIEKVSEDGTGSFQIDMSNVVQADGTAVPSTTLITTTAGTPVSSPAYNAIPGTDLTLSEVVPAGWSLASAICTDQNAGGTGNPTVIGSLTTPTLTIPGANVRPESDIQCRFTNAVAAPALEIVKTGTLNDLDGDGLIDLGESISYSFVATNGGNVTLTGVTIEDPLLENAGIAVTPGPVTLAPGGTATFTATYSPTQADIDAGQVSNTATGTGTPPSGPPIDSPPVTVVVPPDQTPALTIDKTGTLNDADGDGLIDLGETISYSFLATNTGTVTLTGVTIIDQLLDNAGIAVSPGPQTLAPRGTATFTATYAPTQADIDSGSVTNTATGTGAPPSGPPIGSPPDTVTVPPDQSSDLTIDKTGTLNDLDGDDLIDLGETISYAFLVTNTGAVTLSDVTVTDQLLTDAGISVSPGPQTLAPGANVTFTATYTPTQADIDNGSVTNTATGTGTPPSGPPIDSPPDTAVVPPDDTPGLTIDKTGTLNDSDGDGLIDLGETITYSFLATNTGGVTLTGVTVNDQLLIDAGIAVSPGPVTLAPGGTTTFTATYTPTQADIDAGQVSNTATGTGTPPSGPPIGSPPDTSVVPPDQTPALTIDKTGSLNDLDGDDLIDVGETISYSFLVQNTGKVTITNVTVTDQLLTDAGISVTPGPVTLGPGGRVTFTATYAPTQADIDAGRVENTARGTGTPPSGPPIDSPPDTVIVPPDQTSGLTIDKTGTLNDGDGDGLLDPGETITYTFVVTNIGQVTMTNVTVKDPLLTDAGITVTPGPQTLAPDGTFTFTATYTPTQTDIDAGSVENTATGTGTDPDDGITESPPDTITVPPEAPSLRLEKGGRFVDVDGNGHASVGDTLIYSFIATNNGAQTVNDVLPQDLGPTFNGQPAGGSMSDFTPGPVTLSPGEHTVFSATYTLTEDDIVNAGAVPDGIVNSATLRGLTGTGVVTSDGSTSIITMPAAAPGEITVTKVADLRRIYRGQQAPFTIRVTNNSPTTATDITVIDTMPSGFRYVDGSASVDGVAVTPEIVGLRVRLTGLTVPGNGEIVIRLRMLALSSAGPGEHVNRASATDAAGNTVSNEARAVVEILAEPVFDCGDIIGRVFDDENRNGYQDEGELGLPGVRVATVNGWLVTTDAHGRFHVPCAALPDQRIGSNFIMKVDSRTLPTGYRLTTENPRVVRLTAGKMTELNFGASIGRVVRLDLQDAAFEPGRLELRQQWAEGIDELIAFLAVEQSVLRLTYLDPGGDIELAQERLEHLGNLIGDRWRQTSGQYRLDIETRVETGK